MKEDRNQMFFPGGEPMGPMGQMFPGMNPGMAPGMGPGMAPGFGPGFQGGAMPNINQLENRISTLERQVKRLDARISRLETPFPGIGSAPQGQPFSSGPGTFQTSEPQNQQFTSPYQTSMQIM